METDFHLIVGLKIELNPGWHVYGESVPNNYQALTLIFDSPGVEEASLYPSPPTPLLLKARGETLPVYTEGIQTAGALCIK